MEFSVTKLIILFHKFNFIEMSLQNMYIPLKTKFLFFYIMGFYIELYSFHPLVDFVKFVTPIHISIYNSNYYILLFSVLFFIHFQPSQGITCKFMFRLPPGFSIPGTRGG